MAAQWQWVAFELSKLNTDVQLNWLPAPPTEAEEEALANKDETRKTKDKVAKSG